MQRGRFPWRVGTDERDGSLRVIDDTNRVVMYLVETDRTTAERFVRFMNVEAETIRARGRERWLHA